MESQVKVAKTLPKGKQNKALKRKKVKKNIIKNTLDNPFALEWPRISSEREEEVRVILEKSCHGLKKVICKPPWKEVKKYKGAERSAFLDKFRKQFQENLDPDCIRQNQETDEALSHVVFGYNAVMRALEQDRIAGIIVKKNVQPAFIVKTFLPGCANKCIPLFPLTDLDKLLKNENTLVLPHSCMVLGLKPSVREEQNRFHALYVKICEALEINPNVNDESDEEEELEESGEVDLGEEEMRMEQREENLTVNNDSKKSSKILSMKEVKSYHLTRANSSQRAFVPRVKKEQNTTTTDLGADFISFNNNYEMLIPPVERNQLVDRTLQQPTDPNENVVFSGKNMPDQEGDGSNVGIKGDGSSEGISSIKMLDQGDGSNVEISSMKMPDQKRDGSSMIMLNQEGDGNHTADNAKSKTEVCAERKPSNKKNIRKKKRKIVPDIAFVPAKSKRLRGNVNKKTKKSQKKREDGEGVD